LRKSPIFARYQWNVLERQGNRPIALSANRKGIVRMVNRKQLGFVVVMLASLVLSARVASAQTPTFSKDVAPIFQDKCEACHRPDSIAPMSLMTYAEVIPWVRSIRARVADRQMPPWNI